MDVAIYTALSAQTAKFRQMDVVANNMANVDTVGYQREGMLFDQFLVKDSGLRKNAYVNDVATYHNTEQGGLMHTANPLDVAIDGEGYFVVQTPLGPRYTRAGGFTKDAQGQLVTAQGYPVTGLDGQPIQFEEADSNIVITQEGVVRAGAQERGVIGMVSFANPQTLQKASGLLFKSEEEPQPAIGARMLQGVLEKSNVAPVKEITQMIKTMRGVGGTAKFIESAYEMERKTIETYGKVDG